MTVPTIHTRVAALGTHEHRFRGWAAFEELVGEETYVGLIALAISGRRLAPDERALLDDLSTVLTVADPRIWPLKIVRVVASYGSFLAGHAAGQICLEGDRIGPPITRYAAELIEELRKAVGDSIDDREVILREARALVARKKRLIGFGLPFRPVDERYVALRKRLEPTDRLQRPHWRCFEALCEVIREERNLGPNLGSAMGAMLLDMAFTPYEIGALVQFINQHVFVANAVEGSQQKMRELQSLPLECIEYAGVAPRVSPRAR